MNRHELIQITNDMMRNGMEFSGRLIWKHDLEQREALARVEAERDAMESMVLMLEWKEWAEHASKGPISERLETCITTLHNELHEANEQRDMRDAELGEAVALLNCIVGNDVFGNGTTEDLDRGIKEFLTKFYTPKVAGAKS